jgi:bromodomain adjacent to zinc finger domain protein 1A
LERLFNDLEHVEHLLVRFRISFFTVANIALIRSRRHSKPLSLSTFNIDDLASALSHSTSSPRCGLLAEIHAALTNVISTDASRVLGSTTAAPLPTAAQTRDIERGSSADPVDIARRSSVDMELSTVAAEDVDDLDDDLAAPETEEDLDRLVRKGLLYSKKWDRLSKLKLADGRKGWEKHMIGALCQVRLSFARVIQIDC